MVLASLSECAERKEDDTLPEAAALAALVAAQSGGSSSGSATRATAGFCRIFASAANATVNAGVAGLDANCAADANKPSGGGTYKALVSNGTNRRACTTASCSGGTNMSFAVHDDATSACLSVGTQACSNASKVACVEQ